MKSIIIKQGREKSIHHRHPWIFSGAIQKTEGNPEAGEIVEIRDSKGAILAKGYYNARSQIQARILEWNEGVEINRDWREKKIRASILKRKNIAGTDAMRLIYGEADFLPGLIADRYGDYIVLQFLTAGIDRVKKEIVEIIDSILKPKAIYEKSDADVRSLEGLPPSSGLMLGKEVPELLEITENGLKYFVNLKEGQKTGFFLDQRENRKIIMPYAEGKEVLDGFCYTGGFTLSALKGGAKSVVSVDSSAEALGLLEKNLKNNAMTQSQSNIIQADVFTLLRQYRDEERLFDMVILDPPKLAPTKYHRDKALRAYKDVNLLAMRILRENGLLVTFSCSGGVSLADFKMMIGWASIDAKREVQIIRTLSQAEDHPIRVSYPESEYLKGLVCRVI